jgi:hypothetical protein
MESIRGVTWELAGFRMAPRQTAYYLHLAGFRDATDLAVGVAVMAAESSWYLKAWNLNVLRNPDGTIVVEGGKMHVRSADLGWIQRNVSVNRDVEKSEAGSQALIDELFTTHEPLSRPLPSARVARSLFLDRGWQPWVAHTNGSWWRYRGDAALAVGNFLASYEFGLGASYLRRADA